MQPGKYDLNVYRGDSCSWRFTVWQDAAATVPLDLTGVTPAAEVRNGPGGTIYVALPLTITSNHVDVVLSAQNSQKLPAKGVWDLQLTFPNGDVRTIVGGAVTVTADVTDSVVAPAMLRK